MTHKGDRQVAPTGRDGDGCPKLPGGLDSSLIESGTGSAGMTFGRPFDNPSTGLRANGYGGGGKSEAGWETRPTGCAPTS